MFVQRALFLSVSLSGASCQIYGQPLRQVHRRRVCPVVQVDHILPANAKRPRSPVFPAGGGAAFLWEVQKVSRIWYHTTPPWVEPETPSLTKPKPA